MAKEKQITDEELEVLTAPPIFEVLAVKPIKDADGNRWLTEAQADGTFSVYLSTKDGIDMNTNAETEELARENLGRSLAYLRSLTA